MILYWQKVVLKVNIESQNLFLSQFHDLSSMRADSKYRTWRWSLLLSPKPPSGGQYDHFRQYFWQIFALICSLARAIKRVCFANLEMSYSFRDLLKMVWCLVLCHMILLCIMICDIDFSFKMTHPLFKIPTKCMMSSLMLVVSDKSRVQRNFDGLDRLCSNVVATRSARKQNYTSLVRFNAHWDRVA